MSLTPEPNDLVKRHSDLDDLNLKTPLGPQPHPSWVYRNNNNYSQFGVVQNGSGSNPVKRSLSFLSGSGENGGRNHQFEVGKFALLGALVKEDRGASSTLKRSKLANIPESSLEHPADVHSHRHHKSSTLQRHQTNINTTTLRHNNNASTMRHAVIRRHQSMYIHPRTTTDIQPSFTNQQPLQQHYQLREVSGHSEVKPIVTLQRSKTTAGSLHYRSTSIQALHRNTFNTLGGRGVQQRHFQQGGRVKGFGAGATEELCEFQAGRSFDLPDPEKFRRRRYLLNWSGGIASPQMTWNNNNKGSSSSDGRMSDANLCCLDFDSEAALATDNGGRVLRGERAAFGQRMDGEDSCHGTIRYQAMEGLVQKAKGRQSHYSSLENLLDPIDNTSNHLLNRPHFGSTESLSSLGSTNHHKQSNRTTQTPTSLNSSNDDDILYDMPKQPTNLHKSNSRVASVGRLRLHVESFRQMKHTSATQTDLTAMRNSSSSNSSDNLTENASSRLFKKNHVAPPNKPARKTKQQNQQVRRHSTTDCSDSRSTASPDRSDTHAHDHHRSTSPEEDGNNSSTSGYSSPSAGLHSKETSPYGSKIDEKVEELDQRRFMEENGSKITVIQIIPATLNNGMIDSSGEVILDDRFMEEEDEDEEDELPAAASAVQEQRRMQQQQMLNNRPTSPPHRELPRIVTNGSIMNRPSPSFQQNNRQHQDDLQGHRPQQHQQQKRRLPERTGDQPPIRNNTNNNNNHYGTISRRIYRSNLPRPAPLNPFSQGRVPLPPVPELERSDHERESISPMPPTALEAGVHHAHYPRALPSPLTTPIQPNLPNRQPVARARRQPPTPTVNDSPHYQQPHHSRIPRRRSSEELKEEEVDERLRVLLAMLNKGNRGDLRSMQPDLKGGKQDTLQYLSQLENVARRLKDQLMMEEPQVHDRLGQQSRMRKEEDIIEERSESDC